MLDADRDPQGIRGGALSGTSFSCLEVLFRDNYRDLPQSPATSKARKFEKKRLLPGAIHYYRLLSGATGSRCHGPHLGSSAVADWACRYASIRWVSRELKSQGAGSSLVTPRHFPAGEASEAAAQRDHACSCSVYSNLSGRGPCTHRAHRTHRNYFSILGPGRFEYEPRRHK